MSLATRFPDATPEQLSALRDAEAGMGALEARIRLFKEQTLYSLAAAEPPHDHAREQLALTLQEFHQAFELPESPDRSYVLEALGIRQRMWEGVVDMLDAQTACDRHNLEIAEQCIEVLEACRDNPHAWAELVESGVLTDKIPFKPAEQELGYMRGRAQSTLFLAIYTWLGCVDGIDAVLRATGNGEAIEPADAEEAAGRARIVEVVKRAMAEDAELSKALHGLGASLAEAWAYIEWATPVFKSLDELPPEGQRRLLDDPDWLRLNAQVALLAGLPAKVAPWPEIAQFFPEPREAGLPFEVPDWKEPRS